MTVDRVRVGEVLSLQRREIVVEPDLEYAEIGVRSFGRGIFHKEPVSGVQLGNKRVFRIEPGDLVLSNVFAWEGAVALASAEESGRIGSHRFMTFTPINGRIDPSWARWWFLSEPGLELIGRASPGSAGRNRTLAIDRFEALQIPLPPIDEQRRVATRLDRLGVSVAAVDAHAQCAAALTVALADAATREFLHRGIQADWPIRLLGDVAEVNPRPTPLDPARQVDFVPMAAVDAFSGNISNAMPRLVHEVGVGYKQFRQGDVIFARITPCMQNGKSAVFRGDREYGYGSTEFHILRPGTSVTAEWLHSIVRTWDFRSAAAERFTGTAGQQRVPAEFLEMHPIPVPPVEQQPILAASLAQQRTRIEQVQVSRARARMLAAALVPAALNEAFAGLS